MTPRQLQHLAAGLHEFVSEYPHLTPHVRGAIGCVEARMVLEECEALADALDDDHIGWWDESGPR